MTSHQRYMEYYKDELYHFNPYHDRTSGRFTSGRFGYGNVSVSKSVYSKRPLTTSVKNRTDDDIKAIAEIQRWDDNERKHILRGNQILNNAKIMAFKISRSFDNADSKSGLPVMKKRESSEDSLRKVNPSKVTSLASSGNNCCLCTIAFDMRQRGYDVIANQHAPIDLLYDISAEDVSWMYKGFPKETKTGSAKGLERALSRQPDGSRGAAFCTWSGGNSGHVVAYEVKNGKPILYDAQSGTKYEKVSDLFDNVKDTSFIRLDDKEPNYEFVKAALQ